MILQVAMATAPRWREDGTEFTYSNQTIRKSPIYHDRWDATEGKPCSP